MPTQNADGNFYEHGSAARKRQYVQTPQQYNETYVGKRRYGKNKRVNSNVKVSHKNEVVVVLSIVFVFMMIMVITYRYNVISEKNLLSQNLKSELEVTEANLLNAKIQVEQNTDLDYIEAYAKQKLGMQKPSSSQTVYIDTSNITQVIEVNENLSVIGNIVSKIKLALSSIF